MKCEQVRENIFLVLIGEAEEELRVQIEQHVDLCEACQRYMDDARSTFELVSGNLEEGLALYEMKDRIGQRLDKHVTKDKKTSPAHRSIIFRLSLATAAALVIAIGLYTFFNLSQGLPEGVSLEADKGSVYKQVDSKTLWLEKGSIQVKSIRAQSFKVTTETASVSILGVDSDGASFNVSIADDEDKQGFTTIQVLSGVLEVLWLFVNEKIQAIKGETIFVYKTKRPVKLNDNDFKLLGDLKILIQKLSSSEVSVRDESKRRIISLIRQISRTKRDTAHFISKIDSAIENEKDTTRVAALKDVLKRLEQGEWTVLNDCPLDSSYPLKAVYTSDRLIVLGMYKSSDNNVYMTGATYDVFAKKWTKIKDSKLEGRISTLPLVYGNKIVIWGGTENGSTGSFNNGAIYDISTDTWKSMTASPLAGRSDFGACVYHGKVIIWGGASDSTRKFYNDGAIYDVEKDTWIVLKPNSLSARAFSDVIQFDDKALVWNGREANRIFSDGAIYDFLKDDWTIIKECPLEDRILYNTVKFENKLIVWGGHSVLGVCYNDGAIFDVSKNIWTTITECPVKGRAFNSALVQGGKLIIWGGWVGEEVYSKDGAIYDLGKKSWSKINESKINGRGGHACFVHGEKMFVWGGRSKESYNDGAVYNLATGKWSELPQVSIAGRAGTKSALLKDRFLVWDGVAKSLIADGALFELPIQIKNQ